MVFIAWFAIVFTGKYPEGMYEFVAGYTRFVARYTGYAALLCDAYPPWWGQDDPNYPIRLEFRGPLDTYDRLKTLFRIILMIPLVILRYALTVVLELVSIAAWFILVISGQMPRGMFDLMAMANSYIVRSDAYIFLRTETYPPLEEAERQPLGRPRRSSRRGQRPRRPSRRRAPLLSPRFWSGRPTTRQVQATRPAADVPRPAPQRAACAGPGSRRGVSRRAGGAA